MHFQNEVLLEALDVFKNFQTSISSTRNLNFWSTISIGSDFSKSETVVGHILQSALSMLHGCMILTKKLNVSFDEFVWG